MAKSGAKSGAKSENRSRAKDGSEELHLGGRTELITLRAQRTEEKDYETDLEGETWCWLKEEQRELLDQYNLRFLVRGIAEGRVTVGGIRVASKLVVDNGGDLPVLDDGISEKTLEELDYLQTRDPATNHILFVLRRPSKCRQTDRCRLQFRFGPGDSFEFQFKHARRWWGGNVKLINILQEDGVEHEPAYLAARFEVRFYELEVTYGQAEG